MPVNRNKSTHEAMTPINALQLLKEGNQRFINDQRLEYDLSRERSITAESQFPIAVILSCIDSRVTPNLIFDLGIGDLFNVKIPGNIVNDDILGSLEFSCKIAGSKLVLVLGHTSCGAVKGACDHVELGKLTSLLEKIEPAIRAIKTPAGTERSSKNPEFVDHVALKNVELTIDNIKSQSDILRDMLTKGEIMIEGAMYDIETGVVRFLNH
jgi:carbonic anhydrase